MDFVFWSEVSGEEMLNSLGTAQARWLSMLQPVLTAASSKVSCMVGVRGAGPIGKFFSVSVGARETYRLKHYRILQASQPASQPARSQGLLKSNNAVIDMLSKPKHAD